MCMLTERLQILLDGDRRRRLEEEAGARGTSVAALIREAIDLAYPSTVAERRAAADTLLRAEPMEVPDVEGLRAELADVRANRR